MTYEFRGGCSVHIEYQVRDLEELKKVCEVLKDYQTIFTKLNGSASPQRNFDGGNGNGSGNGHASKELIDSLFDLARAKGVLLKKMVEDRYHKSTPKLTTAEAEEIKKELQEK
jgi:hypothetical protein